MTNSVDSVEDLLSWMLSVASVAKPLLQGLKLVMYFEPVWLSLM